MILGVGNKARFFLSVGAVVISVGYCSVVLAESPVIPPDDNIKQLEALIEQQEALIKQQEALIKQQETKVKQQNDSVSQPKASIKKPVQPMPVANKQEPYHVMLVKGKMLFKKWCLGCHDPKSTINKVGPGVKGILKGKKLPVSGRAATPDNIRRQMRTPHGLMPSQFGLTDEEIEQIIKYLETL